METLEFDKAVEDKANRILTGLLSTIDYNNVLRLDQKNGFIYIGNERATPEQLNNLKAEAEFLTQSTIWKLIHETPKELAQRTMFVSSESLVDLQKGKTILFTLDAQKKIVDILKSYNKK